MPRTCLACANPEREKIEAALIAGEPLRSIAKRVSISDTALFRHKQHVSQAIVKASEKREEQLADNLLNEMRRLQKKSWELLTRAEMEGDTRGAVVALREARGCVESLGEMLSLTPNGIDIAAIPDDMLLEEAKRRNLKMIVCLQVVWEERQILNPAALTDDSIRARIAEAPGVFAEGKRRGLYDLIRQKEMAMQQ